MQRKNTEQLPFVPKQHNCFVQWTKEEKILISNCLKRTLEVIEKLVDDTFLFGESSIQEASAWMNLLTNYEDCLGQEINLVKSKIYLFNTSEVLQVKVKNIPGCQFANLLDTYLGLSLMIKEVSITFWNIILETMQKKLEMQDTST